MVKNELTVIDGKVYTKKLVKTSTLKSRLTKMEKYAIRCETNAEYWKAELERTFKDIELLKQIIGSVPDEVQTQ
jgi:hypothetical protein